MAFTRHFYTLTVPSRATTGIPSDWQSVICKKQVFNRMNVLLYSIAHIKGVGIMRYKIGQPRPTNKNIDFASCCICIYVIQSNPHEKRMMYETDLLIFVFHCDLRVYYAPPGAQFERKYCNDTRSPKSCICCIFRSIPTTHFGIIRSLISR